MAGSDGRGREGDRGAGGSRRAWQTGETDGDDAVVVVVVGADGG